MSTATKLWTDVSTWTPTTGANSTAANDTTDFAGETAVKFTTSGRSKSNANFIEISGTWESLFGIAAGSVVSTIGTPDDYDWRCVTFTTGAASTAGPLELRDSGGVLLLTLGATAAYSGTTSRATKAGTAQAVPAAQQASNSSIRLRLNATMATGASNSAVNALVLGHVNITITFVTQQAGNASPAGDSDREAVGAGTAQGRAWVLPSGLSDQSLVGTAVATGATKSNASRGTATPAGDHAHDAVGTGTATGRAWTKPGGSSRREQVGTASAVGASAAHAGTATPSGDTAHERAGTGKAWGRAWTRVASTSRKLAVGALAAMGRATTKVTGLFQHDVVGTVSATGKSVSGGNGNSYPDDQRLVLPLVSMCKPVSAGALWKTHHTKGH